MSNKIKMSTTIIGDKEFEIVDETARNDINQLQESVPSKTSDLNNDSNFITKTVNDLTNYYLKTETYTQEEINAKLSAIPKFSIQPVVSLPISDISTTTVYLLKSGDETDNLYTEYIYVGGAWEYLGKQTVDLTGYALKTDIPTKLSALSNDAGFITNAVSDLVNYYTNTEIDSKLNQLSDDIGNKLDTNVLSESINTALAQAKESGEFDGANGKDGVSVTHSWNGTVLTVTSSSGTSSADLKGEKGDTGDTGAQGEKGDTGDTGAQGEKGDTGATGERGNTFYVYSAEPTAEPSELGETDILVYTVVEALSGIKVGDFILNPKTNNIYKANEWLYAGTLTVVLVCNIKGDTGAQGEKGDTGAQGEKGDKGDTGADGKTPVKGTDYFTDADKAEMVNAVIAALPVYSGEVI